MDWELDGGMGCGGKGSTADTMTVSDEPARAGLHRMTAELVKAKKVKDAMCLEDRLLIASAEFSLRSYFSICFMHSSFPPHWVVRWTIGGMPLQFPGQLVSERKVCPGR